MIYCVIPRDLADSLYDKMVDYYKDNPNVTVIVDRRDGPDRRNESERAVGGRGAADDARPPPRPSGHVPGHRRPARVARARLAAWRPRRATLKNFIGGEWVDAASGETFESTSPANGETIGVFPNSGAEDVDRAVAAAKAAYEEWRLVPAPKRGEILFRLARLLEDEKAALTDLMTHEMGKVKAEAGGDVQEAIDITYYMAGEGRRLFGQTTPSELQNKWNMSIRVPIGVVGAITPWNFPVAIPSWKLDARRSSAGTPSSSSRPRTRRPSPSASSSCSRRPAFPTASSTSSTATARAPASRSSAIPTFP